MIQCKEWTLSRSMLRKFSQGDGAPKAVVQAFLRSRLSKKKIVATVIIAGPSARFRTFIVPDDNVIPRCAVSEPSNTGEIERRPALALRVC